MMACISVQGGQTLLLFKPGVGLTHKRDRRQRGQAQCGPLWSHQIAQASKAPKVAKRAGDIGDGACSICCQSHHQDEDNEDATMICGTGPVFGYRSIDNSTHHLSTHCSRCMRVVLQQRVRICLRACQLEGALHDRRHGTTLASNMTADSGIHSVRTAWMPISLTMVEFRPLGSHDPSALAPLRSPTRAREVSNWWADTLFL